MGDLSIRARLTLLVGLMTAALVLVWGLGWYASRTAEGDMRVIFENHTLPMREVARIRRLYVDNAGHMFRAMQHNPAIEYSKLHDHPVSEHLALVRKNLDWMTETFAALEKHLLPDSEELKMVREIHAEYLAYVEKSLKPAMEAMQAGNYSLEMAGTFLKGNRAFEAKLNPMMRQLAQVQEDAVKNLYEHAMAFDAKMSKLSFATLVIAAAICLTLAVMTIGSISRTVKSMQDIIVRARDGDFTGAVRIERRDEIGVAAEAFNELMATLRRTLAELRDSTVRIDESTASLATAAHQAAIASDETSGAASSMAASVEEMSVSITSVSDSTREALDVARLAGEHSETGGAVIASAVSEMTEIAGRVRVVGETITVLGDQSNKISSVIQVIKDVADQTNLLALNAAIEAARAGEAGRGFAVVADEVRKLAERTTLATGEIAQVIEAIQSSASSAVGEMDSTMARLQRGTELAAQAGEAIVAIRDSANRVLEVVSEINSAMAEQGSASQDIAQRVERVAQASEESSASVGISADAARNIHDQSRQMRDSMARFKV